MGKAQRSSDRPPDWGPAWVLEWANSGPDIRLYQQCQIWAAEWRTTVDTLIAEIRRWRKRDSALDAALVALRSPNATAGRDPREATDGDWRERWAGFYRVHHNRKRAAEEAEIPWETVRKKLSQASVEFDARLAALAEDIEAETLESAREGLRTTFEVLGEAANDGDVKAADALGRQAMMVLERREPSTWGRQQTVTVQGSILHIPVEARREGLANAINISRQAVPSAEAAALPAHQEGIVLDLQKVAVHVALEDDA